jgi:hypothetical protein
MDSFTFTGRSAVIVIAPELESWLCCDPPFAEDFAVDVNDPKKTLEQAFLRTRGRSIPIRDFEQIASRANLELWNSSPSFRILKETLQNWFPRL